MSKASSSPRKDSKKTTTYEDLQKQLNDVKSVLGNIKPKTYRPARFSRRRGRYNFRSNFRIPAAYGSTKNVSSRIYYSRGLPVLFCQEIFPLVYQDKAIMFALPMTPSKWIGTRAAILSSTFTGYRPFYVEIEYQPALGTQSQGNIAVGTVFDGSSVNIESKSLGITSLPATNGGFVTQIYGRHTTRISLGTCLRSNLFPLYNTEPDDIPFWILVSCDANVEADTVIGNLVIRYKCSMKNPSIQPNRATAALNVKGQITHTPAESGNGDTKLALPIASIVNELVQGRDYYVAFNEALKNSQGEAVVRQIQPINVSNLGKSGNDYLFELAPNIVSTANVFCTLLGAASTNFL